MTPIIKLSASVGYKQREERREFTWGNSIDSDVVGSVTASGCSRQASNCVFTSIIDSRFGNSDKSCNAGYIDL
jgi:hypothetical protein